MSEPLTPEREAQIRELHKECAPISGQPFVQARVLNAINDLLAEVERLRDVAKQAVDRTLRSAGAAVESEAESERLLKALEKAEAENARLRKEAAALWEKWRNRELDWIEDRGTLAEFQEFSAENKRNPYADGGE